MSVSIACGSKNAIARRPFSTRSRVIPHGSKESMDPHFASAYGSGVNG